MIKYKYSKFGSLPGTITKWAKIYMLEHKEPLEYTEKHIINKNQIKSYKKEFVKKANRRFRHNKIINQ
jgi:hypothetical protein